MNPPPARDERPPSYPWPERLRDRTDLRDALLAAYAEPHRSYHTTRHLAEVLANVEGLLPASGPRGRDAVDRDAVLLAAWFHDAVYDGSRDDEERSAALAEEQLTGAGAPAALVAEVARLVRLTAEHQPADDDHAGQVLSDADLAILGAEPERYDEYTAAVRAEYSDLDDDTFREGRRRVLEALLRKPALFHTAAARDRWERAARDNVQRELSLRGRPAAPGSP